MLFMCLEEPGQPGSHVSQADIMHHLRQVLKLSRKIRQDGKIQGGDLGHQAVKVLPRNEQKTRIFQGGHTRRCPPAFQKYRWQVENISRRKMDQGLLSTLRVDAKNSNRSGKNEVDRCFLIPRTKDFRISRLFNLAGITKDLFQVCLGKTGE